MNNKIAAGRGPCLYMGLLTLASVIAIIYTVFFIDTDAVMKSPRIGLLEIAMWVTMILNIIFVLWHSTVVKGPRPALLAAVVTILLAWFAEGLGVNYGMIFGAYHYSDLLGYKIWGVPLVVCIGWEPILYAAYMMTDLLIPSQLDKSKHLFQRGVPIVMLAAVGAVVATVLDLVGDPDAVSRGWWIWHDGGPYVTNIHGGVPITNYTGWLALSFVCQLVYRLVHEVAPRTRRSVYLNVYGPVLLYLNLFLFVETFAYLYVKRMDVVLIGMAIGGILILGIAKVCIFRFGAEASRIEYGEDDRPERAAA